MDGNLVDEEGGPLGCLGSKLLPEAADSRAALPRPFAFPNLKQVQLIADTRESTQRSEECSVVTASSLTQEVEAPAASPDGLKVPDNRWDGTPLPPNVFEPLSAAANARADAFTLVPIANIIIGERLRGVVEAFIPIMVDSMSSYAVIQPPVVRPDPSDPAKYVLVSGLQRVNAARLRGADEILCRVAGLTEVEAQLWEIDENLVRAALSPAEEALFIDRRRELHEQLHGKSKARGALAANAAMGRNDASAKLADASFTAATAKRTGKSQRAVQRIVQRAAQNGRANLVRIAGTSLDRKAELDALPLLPRAAQEILIARAAEGDEVSAVQAKEAYKPPSSTESHVSEIDSVNVDNDVPGLITLKSAWLGASDAARESFLAWINNIDPT